MSDLVVVRFDSAVEFADTSTPSWVARVDRAWSHGAARLSVSLDREGNRGNRAHLLELPIEDALGATSELQPAVDAVTAGINDAEVAHYTHLGTWLNGEPDVSAADCLVAVWMSSPDPDELACWYHEEHIPLLFDVPGWLRCRRYERTSGEGLDYLALHELQHESTVDHPAAAPARNTPWRTRVIGALHDSEYRVYGIEGSNSTAGGH